MHETVQQKRITYAVLIAPLLLLGILSLYHTQGRFTYSLDDPYIHLALAENISKGHYGVNPEEFSSPSSSILWPFLLAIFAPLSNLFVYIPLLINLVLAIATGRMILLQLPFDDWRKRLAVTMLICFSMNLYGLVFTGMEHNLQVWLTMVIVAGLLKQKYTRLFFCALIILPLVRYEGLAISLPFLLYAFSKGYKKAATISLLVIAVTMGGFSYYLYANSRLWLPTSVLTKASVSNLGGIVENAKVNIRLYGFLSILVLWLVLIKYPKDIWYSAALVMTTFLFLLFGRFGAFGRYENFFLLFLLMIFLNDWLPTQKTMWLIIFCLPLVFSSLSLATVLTPNACGNIYRQQKQMAAIAVALDERIAINDLGLVSLYSPHFILDLWGLGSVEASKASTAAGDPKNVGWISELMRKNSVEYAMVYDDWLTYHPDDWITVGKLSVSGETAPLGAAVVTFYATNQTAANKLKSVLAAHKKQMNLSRVEISME